MVEHGLNVVSRILLVLNVRFISPLQGEVWARGAYVLKVCDEFSEIQSSEHLQELMSGFSLFNGQTINLSDGNQLVPDGVIDSPFPYGGKTTEYSQGVVTRAEEQYQ